MHKFFYFRATDRTAFLEAAKEVCIKNDIDPFALGMLKREPQSQALLPGKKVDLIPSGSWVLKEAIIDKIKDDEIILKEEPILGSYALANVYTDNEDLVAVVEQFPKTDPSLSPSEVPADEQIGSGVHRIDGSMVSSPARTW